VLRWVRVLPRIVQAYFPSLSFSSLSFQILYSKHIEMESLT
jgi:hypothetical protein